MAECIARSKSALKLREQIALAPHGEMSKAPWSLIARCETLQTNIQRTMTVGKSWQNDCMKSEASLTCDAIGGSLTHSSKDSGTREDDIDDDSESTHSSKDSGTCEDDIDDDSEGLHVGWCRFQDPVSGRPYYAHRQSKVCLVSAAQV